ncbi:hypothetical protein LY78DRAFT_330591 [Colletotrichum sublineola]|nr:hypothetical protein LY78DRAFT_330591 [Colletotrichum sublineola]
MAGFVLYLRRIHIRYLRCSSVRADVGPRQLDKQRYPVPGYLPHWLTRHPPDTCSSLSESAQTHLIPVHPPSASTAGLLTLISTLVHTLLRGIYFEAPWWPLQVCLQGLSACLQINQFNLCIVLFHLEPNK